MFTNIGLDHYEILGDTMESVAKNKSDIIKVGCDFYPSSLLVNKNIYDIFVQRSATLHIADFSKIGDAIYDESVQTFNYIV